MKLFIIIQPDGQTHLDIINKLILNENFAIKERYLLVDWNKVIYKLHKKEIDKNADNFIAHFDTSVYLSNTLYGRYGMLLVLERKNYDSSDDEIYLNSFESVFLLKNRIREQVTVTKSIFNIMADMSQVSKFSYETCEQPVWKDNNRPASAHLPSTGDFKFFYFNNVHCPDPNYDSFCFEWNILSEFVVNSKNAVPEDIWNKCIKYNTFAFAIEYVTEENGD